MDCVLCASRPGLRDGEAAVTVVDARGARHCLRVERDLLRVLDERAYPLVGVVGWLAQRALVELPHGADSGTQRLWVEIDRVRELP